MVRQREVLGSAVANIGIVMLDPILTRRHVAAVRPPVPTVEADHRHQRVLLSVHHQLCRVRDRRVQRGGVEHEDLREGRHQQLLRATLRLALLARPIRNHDRSHRVNHAVRQTLLALRRRDGELNHRVRAHVLVRARIALDGVADLEATELIKEGQFIAHVLEQLVRVTDALAGGHHRRAHTFVEGLQTFVALAAPDFLKRFVDGRGIQSRFCNVACLDIRNTEEGLKSCVDPAGTALITKSEGGRHLTSGTQRNLLRRERDPFSLMHWPMNSLMTARM